MRKHYIFATSVVFAVAVTIISFTIYTIPPAVIAAGMSEGFLSYLE